VAPAIVSLQARGEELRQAELQRVRARLGSLTPEQAAAVESLSRGLVAKFLHPPMQALKQAARAGDMGRIDAIRQTYGVPGEPEPGGIRLPVEEEPVEQEKVGL